MPHVQIRKDNNLFHLIWNNIILYFTLLSLSLFITFDSILLLWYFKRGGQKKSLILRKCKYCTEVKSKLTFY